MTMDKDKTTNQNTTEIKPYDFKRPDKFSKEQITTIRNIHEQFARLSTTSLSTRLKTTAILCLDQVNQQTFGEFLNDVLSPTTIAVLNLDPLGSAILEIDPNVTFAILERLYGSGLSGTKALNRPITEIEQHLISDIISALTSNLSTAWLFLTSIKPRISHIETNPSIVQTINPNEMTILISFRAKIGNTQGSMKLCLPYITLEPIMPRLSPKFFYSSIKKSEKGKDDLQHINRVFSLLEDSKANLSITINTPMLPLIEIDSFKEGDEIPVCALSEMVSININGYKVMEGNLGHRDNKWTVKVRKFADE
jgi:flagellar motor switch protein FliM